MLGVRGGLLCKMATVTTLLVAALLLLLAHNTPAAAKKGPRVTDLVSWLVTYVACTQSLSLSAVGVF